MTRRRRIAANILMICFGLVVGLALFEAGARVLHISYPIFQVHDPQRGFALRPFASGWWLREGEAYVEINSDGLRDREHARAKPDNTVRVAILGDSYAEARSVAMEDTFWSVLERKLSACHAIKGKTVEVINFGVTDYGTAQELLTLRNHAWDYDPDLVLLAFFADNDVRNNSAELEPKKYRPFFRLVDGKLVRDDGFLGTKAYRLLSSWPGRMALSLSDHLISVQVAREFFVRWFLSSSGRAREEGDDPKQHSEQGLDAGVYADPPQPEWERAWRVTEALVGTMAREVSEHGAEFLMVTLSSGLQTDPDPAARKEFADRLGLSDLFYPERRLAALAEKRNFEILSLAPRLQDYAQDNDIFLHGFPNTEPGTGHWNETGHRVAGSLIADHVCRQWSDRLSRSEARSGEIQ